MDQIPDTFPFMFAGYAVIWGLLSLYIIYLGKRLMSLERKLKESEGHDGIKSSSS